MIAVMKDIIGTFKWGLKEMLAMALLLGGGLGVLLSFVYVITHFDFPLPYPVGGSKLELALYSLGYAVVAYIALLAITKSFVKCCEFLEKLFR